MLHDDNDNQPSAKSKKATNELRFLGKSIDSSAYNQNILKHFEQPMRIIELRYIKNKKGYMIKEAVSNQLKKLRRDDSQINYAQKLRQDGKSRKQDINYRLWETSPGSANLPVPTTATIYRFMSAIKAKSKGKPK